MFDDTRGYSESVEHIAPLATRDGLLVWLTKLYNVNPGCLVRRGDIHIMYIIVYIYNLYIDVYPMISLFSLEYKIIKPVFLSR
jgi:hypothetical protein